MSTVPPPPPSQLNDFLRFGDTGGIAGITQPGGSISIDGRGLLESSWVFIYESDTGQLPLVPTRGSPHPTDPRMKCYKVDCSFGNNGEVRAIASYIGLAKDPTDAEIEITGSTGETSIVFHPGFPVWAIEKQADPKKKTPVKYNRWVETDDQNNFVRFKVGECPANFGGVESYLTPRCTIRCTYYTGRTSSVRGASGSLGKAFDYPGNFPQGLLTSTKANWLLTSVGVTEYGTVFKISEEYMLSEAGQPWNPWIYGSGSQGGIPINRIGGQNNQAITINKIGDIPINSLKGDAIRPGLES